MIVPGLDPPVIIQQPLGQTVIAGTNLALSVTVTGAPPMSFQWKLNGTNIPGATSSNLLIANVNSQNGGTYTVAVTNYVSGVLSDAAVLTVLFPAAITRQPQGLTAYWGKSASFGVAATGSAPLSYQWLKDGSPIPFGTKATLTLPILDTNASGDYFVVVSNVVNSVTSNPALLVLIAAGITPYAFPGFVVEGVVGQTYGIQYATNVSQTSQWIPLTNLTLTQPAEVWVDASVVTTNGSISRRFYRIVALP